VFLFIISVVLGALQWQIILKNRNVQLPFGKVLRIYFVGIFFNNFIFGIVAGDTFKVATLHLDKNSGKAGFAATFLDRLAGLLIISLFAIIGGIIIFVSNIQQNKQFFMVLGVLAIFISIFIGFFIIIFSQRLQRLLRKVIISLPDFPGKETIQNILEEIFINRHGREDKKMLARVAFISLLIQSLRISVNIVCAQALGLFSFGVIHYFFVIFSVIALLMIVPMPFGVRETVGGFCFGLAGFSTEEAVIMLFLTTIVCVIGSLVGGILFLGDKKVVEPEPAELEPN
jgi:uncharacterized protein (TIRG00374 family)